MGHYGALWGVFKRDISKSIQANPIVPHNAPWLPPSITVDDKRKTSNKNKVNFTNWARIKSKNYTRLTKWPCLPHEMAKISSTPIVRLRVHFSRHCDFNQISD